MEHTHPRPARRRANGAGTWTGLALLLPALVLVGAGVVYPVALSVWNSLTRVEAGVGAYEWIFANPVYLEILGRSYLTAIIAVVACILLGYPYAYLMVVSGQRTRAVLLTLVLVPLWISGLARIFAWVILLQPGGPVSTWLGLGDGEGILRTPLAVMIGMVQVLMPFFVLPAFNTMNRIDHRLVDAAVSLGAKPAAAHARVFLPLAVPGILAGALTVFVMALGFYILPLMLGSPTSTLIGEVIYTQASALSNPGRAGALSTLLLVGAALICLVTAWVARPLLTRSARAKGNT